MLENKLIEYKLIRESLDTDELVQLHIDGEFKMLFHNQMSSYTDL